MFVVCGEALFDIFAGTPNATGLALEARVGGSPFNVAVGLARLGQPVGFLGTLSNDFFGQRLRSALRDEGVRMGCTQRSDAPTTLSVVGLDAHGVPSYAFHGEHGADRQLDIGALDALPVDTRVLQLGSYALVVEPIGRALRALVEREHRQRLIAYDPNVRLQVEPALQRWRSTIDWMLPRTDLLKVSAEDLALLYPDAEPSAIAAQWLARGASLVVVTHGSDGAAAWTATARAARASVPVQTIDTVGAGDSFQAALLTWLAENDRLDRAALAPLDETQLQGALDFATRAAAITCSRRGADLPRRSEL